MVSRYSDSFPEIGLALGAGRRCRGPSILPSHPRAGSSGRPSAPPTGAGPVAGRRRRHWLRWRLWQICRWPLRSPRAGSFRQRLWDPGQKGLVTCLRRPEVPPTPNQAERNLRPVVVMRCVIQGTRSDKELENHRVLRSQVGTARRQGKALHLFLQDLFKRHHRSPGRAPRECSRQDGRCLERGGEPRGRREDELNCCNPPARPLAHRLARTWSPPPGPPNQHGARRVCGQKR